MTEGLRRMIESRECSAETKQRWLAAWDLRLQDPERSQRELWRVEALLFLEQGPLRGPSLVERGYERSLLYAQMRERIEAERRSTREPSKAQRERWKAQLEELAGSQALFNSWLAPLEMRILHVLKVIDELSKQPTKEDRQLVEDLVKLGDATEAHYRVYLETGRIPWLPPAPVNLDLDSTQRRHVLDVWRARRPAQRAAPEAVSSEMELPF